MPQDLMFGATWSLPQLLIVLLLVVLLFGKGKVSDLMGDVAKGIKSFKKGLADDDAPPAPPQSAGREHAEAHRPRTRPHGSKSSDGNRDESVNPFVHCIVFFEGAVLHVRYRVV